MPELKTKKLRFAPKKLQRNYLLTGMRLNRVWLKQ